MLKYFLPEWRDRLDPGFDFVSDDFSEEYKRSPYEVGCYAHQLFDSPPYEGMLFSLYNLISGNHNGFRASIFNQDGNPVLKGHQNIRDYLKFNKYPELEVMGDCGAFGYVNCLKPPDHFSVKNVAWLYDTFGFDLGVSVDHLVVDNIVQRNSKGIETRKVLTIGEKRQRIALTKRNAKAFYNEWKERGYGFRPIGVAQGFDVKSYKGSVKCLIDMGYDYIALGSLVNHDSEFIIEVLEAIENLTKGIDLHLFGVLRPNDLGRFVDLGVTSFDSASFLRKAWLRSGQNYLGSNGKWYAAIRVPQSDNKALIKNADTNGYCEADIKRMECDVLSLLRYYDQGNATLNEVLESVTEYDSLLLRDTEDFKNIIKRYKTTLEDKPWKYCSCKMCRSIGIDVVIFRGTNRNKRRGFHNIYTFRARNKNLFY